MTRLVKFLLQIAGIAFVIFAGLKLFFPLPIQFLEWKWGAETQLTPAKPFEDVQVLRMEDSIGRYFEAETEPLLARAATGDPEAIREFAEKLREHKASVQTVHEAYSGGSIRRDDSQTPPPPPAMPSGPTTEQLSQLPPTPTGVEVEQGDGFRRILWPPNGSGWTLVDVLQPGEIPEADPTGRICGYPDSDACPVGPEGQDRLSRSLLRSKLIAPNAPAYSLVVKLGADGEPFALAGRFRKTPTAVSQATPLFAWTNDFPSDIDTDGDNKPDDGVSDNIGSFPIIVRTPPGSR